MSERAVPIVRQASCVLVDGRALLIEGPPGSGKSALALALIDRGAMLVGDDAVTLAPRDGTLWASPPPNIRGLLEIRNVGLVELPVAEGPVALLVRLDREAPRHIEHPQRVIVCGTDLPELALFPDTPALPLRAEWALRRFGTTG